MLVLQPTYKYPESPCDLRKDGLDTRLFISTPYNGTYQVLRMRTLSYPSGGESMLRRLF